MWKRRGFNPSLSFAAFERKDIVSFTLNGVGKFNGQKTASNEWDFVINL